jgi:hypothetical protein
MDQASCLQYLEGDVLGLKKLTELLNQSCFEKFGVNLFLDLKPVNEIAAKLLPRHLSYIIKQFRKILEPSVYTLFKKVPNRLELLESLFKENNFPEDLSTLIAKLIFKQTLSLDDIRKLMNLITENRRVLKAAKDGSTQDISEATRKMAFHLMKMVRVFEEINFVWKKVQCYAIRQ